MKYPPYNLSMNRATFVNLRVIQVISSNLIIFPQKALEFNCQNLAIDAEIWQ